MAETLERLYDKANGQTVKKASVNQERPVFEKSSETVRAMIGEKSQKKDIVHKIAWDY